MRSNEVKRFETRVEKLTAALEWALSKGVNGYLNRLGYPTYDVHDGECERSIEPDEYLKSTLDPVVRGAQLNGVSLLSPRPPIDPTREAVFDARIAMQDKVIASMHTQLDTLFDAVNERNAYQNMLIRAVVMGASTNVSEDEWRAFTSKCGDLLIHWSKKQGSG